MAHKNKYKEIESVKNNLQVLGNNKQVTITSVELVDLINQFRIEEDKDNYKPKQHNTLLRDIRNEIEVLKGMGVGVYNFVQSTYTNSQNKQQPCFVLNRDGALQMLNKESAYVRHKTIEYIHILEQALVETQMDSYMIVDPVKRAERWIEEEKERQRLEQENKYLVQDNKHKEEVIQGITETLDKPTLRSRINQIVKYGAKSGYQGRYRLLYSEFEKTHHMNLKLRLAKAIDNGTLKKSANRMDLICDHLDMTQELYEVAIRVFEGDFYKLGLDIVEYVKRGQQEYLSLECK